MTSDNIHLKRPLPSEIAGWIKIVLDQIPDVKEANERAGGSTIASRGQYEAPR